MRLPCDIGIPLIEKALEKRREGRLHLQWAVQLPYMEDFVPFSEYVDRCTGKNLDLRPVSMILAELNELERRRQDGNRNI